MLLIPLMLNEYYERGAIFIIGWIVISILIYSWLWLYKNMDITNIVVSIIAINFMLIYTFSAIRVYKEEIAEIWNNPPNSYHLCELLESERSKNYPIPYFVGYVILLAMVISIPIAICLKSYITNGFEYLWNFLFETI